VFQNTCSISQPKKCFIIGVSPPPDNECRPCHVHRPVPSNFYVLTTLLGGRVPFQVPGPRVSLFAQPVSPNKHPPPHNHFWSLPVPRSAPPFFSFASQFSCLYSGLLFVQSPKPPSPATNCGLVVQLFLENVFLAFFNHPRGSSGLFFKETPPPPPLTIYVAEGVFGVDLSPRCLVLGHPPDMSRF